VNTIGLNLPSPLKSFSKSLSWSLATGPRETGKGDTVIHHTTLEMDNEIQNWVSLDGEHWLAD
jgi:hypothetical protein